MISPGGYANYDQIVIKQRKGRIRIMGIGVTADSQQVRPIAGMSQVHSDNVVGAPASLSDTRLKDNQEPVPLSTLVDIFNAVETRQYDFRGAMDMDGQPLPSERRVGFIADEVKAALPADWTNVVGSKHSGDQEYLTLDYSRMVSVLWGVVKQLSARVAVLEG